MNPGMPTSAQVIADFGEEFFIDLISAVDGAVGDLEIHRGEHPDWAATYSPRHVASFLHERIWGRMLLRFDVDERIAVNEKTPHHEITLGTAYRARFKRHLPDDSVSNFPTDGSIEFWAGTGALETLEQYPVAFGYRWDPIEGVVESPVFSLRESADKAIWVEDLFRRVGGDGATRIFCRPAPDVPRLDLGDLAQEILRDRA